MEAALHYLLMANHFMFQKMLFAGIRDTELTLGQPKVLDYLKEHDGAVQKDLAASCHIEQASLTSVLGGMEKKGLITRRMCEGNRRNLYVFLTEKGWNSASRITSEFADIEDKALSGFTPDEISALNSYLSRVHQNICNRISD